MPKKRTYLFTKPTEIHGILGRANWAQPTMRMAINMGTGSWFCEFVDGEWRAAIEMGDFLVKLGFLHAYKYACQEKDSAKLATTALKFRKGEVSREQLDTLVVHLQQKYARNFESRPLMVASRLAQAEPCMVASAMCLDGVQTDFEEVTGAIIDYARRVIRP